MQGQLHERSVTLSLSADEYRTVQEVLAAAHDLEPRILRVSHEDIDLLARHVAEAPCGEAGERTPALSLAQFGNLGLIVGHTANIIEMTEVGSSAPPIRSESPLRERPDIREIHSKLSKLVHQLFLLRRQGKTLPVN
jgi:hypothetical protein